jgi:hypothetical protein
MPTYTGSQAKVGRGTVVSIGGVSGAGGSEIFTQINELDKASFTGGKWGTADSTNFNSGVNDEFLTTIRDNGSVSLSGNLVDQDPGQVALAAAYANGLKYDFKVQLLPGPVETTTGTLYSFSALVESFFDIPVTTKDIIKFTSSLKISGPITETVGS